MLVIITRQWYNSESTLFFYFVAYILLQDDSIHSILYLFYTTLLEGEPKSNEPPFSVRDAKPEHISEYKK